MQQSQRLSSLIQHIDENQSRKWNFDQKWDNTEHALNRENYQRKDDVDFSKRNIQNKLSTLKQLEANKTALINDNLKFLMQQANGIDRNINDFLDQNKDLENDNEHKYSEFITNYLHDSQSFTDKILSYAKAKCGDIERKLQNVDQNIKRRTNQQMKELKEGSIQHIRLMMAQQNHAQKENLESMNCLVVDSLKNMRQSLKEYEQSCQLSDQKIQDEMMKLDRETAKMLDKQNKEGEMTYDCLLKLVQDSCSKIQYVQ